MGHALKAFKFYTNGTELRLAAETIQRQRWLPRDFPRVSWLLCCRNHSTNSDETLSWLEETIWQMLYPHCALSLRYKNTKSSSRKKMEHLHSTHTHTHLQHECFHTC